MSMMRKEEQLISLLFAIQQSLDRIEKLIKEELIPDVRDQGRVDVEDVSNRIHSKMLNQLNKKLPVNRKSGEAKKTIVPDFIKIAADSKRMTDSDMDYRIAFCEQILAWLQGLKGEDLVPNLSVSYNYSSNQYQIKISIDAAGCSKLDTGFGNL